MADNKKYYYLKLKDNFFDTDEMIILESMQDGYLYSNILLKLYLRSLKNEGKLMFNNKIPFNSTMLSQVTRMNVGVIEKAVDIFKELGLIEVLDNGAIFMTDIQNFIGNSSTEADRKRLYRNKIENEKGQKSDKCPDKNPPEIELKKELKKEEEKEKSCEILPKEILDRYREKISNLNEKVKEKKSLTALFLVKEDFEKILIGIDNYSVKAKEDQEQYRKNLYDFINDGIYLDYQQKVKSKYYPVPKNLIDKKFIRHGDDCYFTEKGFYNITKDYEIVNYDNAEEAVNQFKEFTENKSVSVMERLNG